MTPEQVADAVRADARRSGFVLDADQEAALPVLAALVTGGSGGAYLWGPPGRGKTWLVDAALRAARPAGVLRLHAVALYARLHAAVGREQQADPSGSWDRAVAALLAGVRLLVVDDLQLTDSDDAWMAERVLAPVPALVVTSNTAADRLHDDPGSAGHADGVRRLLRARTVDLRLGGPLDHRTAGGTSRFATGAFLSPGGGRRLADLGLVAPGAAQRAVLEVGGRPLPVLAAADDALWVTFGALCERPTGPGDHLALAQRFGTWVVVGLPPLGDCPPDPLARLLSVVDVAADADVRLVLVARQPREQTVPADVDLPGWPRLVSRLAVLRG